MFTDYKSPLGYVADGKKIDTYGVDHSGFTTKDEIEYQMARQKRENSLIEGYNNQGITKDYPQYGTNFWGKADNNYGFGSSNIADNIKDKQNQDISSALYPNQIGNDAASYKLAQNNQANTASDANTLSENNLSDGELFEIMYPIIKNNENAKFFPYYDTRWNITTGVGNNINNKNDFYNTKWTINGVPATKQDLDDCLKNLQKEKSRIQNERIQARQNPQEHNYKADYFDKFCNIRINEDTMHQMSMDHMKDDLKNLRILIPNFDNLSLNKKIVLMDYMYNLGPNKFSEKNFFNFINIMSYNTFFNNRFNIIAYN